MNLNLFREKSILDEIVLDWGSTENSINEIDVKKGITYRGKLCTCPLRANGPEALSYVSIG